MKFKTLTRNLFLDSVTHISDMKTLKFAKEAMDLWDNFYSWEKWPPLCLIHDDMILSYLFYSTTKDNEYLIIHRILTPKQFRRKNYGHELFGYLFSKLSNTHIKRFRMSCVSSSIPFYNDLGLNYWGVNDKGQYYCDFKMPIKKIEEIPLIVKEANILELSNAKVLKIYENLKDNGRSFNLEEKNIHDNCLDIMGEKYRFKELTKAAGF